MSRVLHMQHWSKSFLLPGYDPDDYDVDNNESKDSGIKGNAMYGVKLHEDEKNFILDGNWQLKLNKTYATKAEFYKVINELITCLHEGLLKLIDEKDKPTVHILPERLPNITGDPFEDVDWGDPSTFNDAAWDQIRD